jgi:hypothetical protein
VNEVADEYLTGIDGQNREKEAIRRFCATPFLLDDLLATLGVPAGLRCCDHLLVVDSERSHEQ